MPIDTHRGLSHITQSGMGTGGKRNRARFKGGWSESALLHGDKTA